mmetsp:Transcript_10755/g.17624  ORF Transcript_10755/g.17624 Transcript_10755/m.17624 type:complete len:120 (+) Transcript_10755:188-547(+)
MAESSQGADEECRMETLRAGDSTNYPQPGDSVRVHYEGFLLKDNVKFDSSKDRGRPLEFMLGAGQLILGWEETIPKMSRGQIVRVTVPSKKAYGVTGYPPIIPPMADLMFEIELVSFTT